MVVVEQTNNIDNLLLNITNQDYIYNVIRRFLGHLLPKELQESYESSYRIQLLATDIFFLHYSSSPLLTLRASDSFLEQARILIERYMDTDKFKQNRVYTTLDELSSLAYSSAFLKKLLESMFVSVTENVNRNAESRERYRGTGKLSGSEYEKGVEKRDKTEKDKKGGIRGSEEPSSERELNLNIREIENKHMNERAFEDALQAASVFTRTFREVKDIIASGGASKEVGRVEELIDLTELILNVKEAEEILKLVKKAIREMPKYTLIAKRGEVLGEELKGYRRTKRIDSAIYREYSLPSELFLVKLSNEGLLTKEKEMYEQSFIYMLLDKSGSMNGYKLIWSRSVALAFLKLAQNSKISFCLRLFDSVVYPYESPITNFKDAFKYILTTPSNGGTNIQSSLTTAFDDIKKTFKANEGSILLITDGEDRVSLSRKDVPKNVMLYSIMVGGDNATLKNISDEYIIAGVDDEGFLRLVKEGEKIVLARKYARKYLHA